MSRINKKRKGTILVAEAKDNNGDWCKHESQMRLCVICGDVLENIEHASQVKIATVASNRTIRRNWNLA